MISLCIHCLLLTATRVLQNILKLVLVFCNQCAHFQSTPALQSDRSSRLDLSLDKDVDLSFRRYEIFSKKSLSFRILFFAYFTIDISVTHQLSCLYSSTYCYITPTLSSFVLNSLLLYYLISCIFSSTYFSLASLVFISSLFPCFFEREYKIPLILSNFP